MKENQRTNKGNQWKARKAVENQEKWKENLSEPKSPPKKKKKNQMQIKTPKQISIF